jgi:hypothetical protein
VHRNNESICGRTHAAKRRGHRFVIHAENFTAGHYMATATPTSHSEQRLPMRNAAAPAPAIPGVEASTSAMTRSGALQRFTARDLPAEPARPLAVRRRPWPLLQRRGFPSRDQRPCLPTQMRLAARRKPAEAGRLQAAPPLVTVEAKGLHCTAQPSGHR